MYTLLLSLILFQACSALQWASSSALPDGTVFPACSGQDVTLAWSYTPDADEHLMNVEWHFTPPGGDATLLGTQVMGNFFATPTISQSLQFIPDAGIRIQNIAPTDSGTYSVHVNMNRHGSVVTEVQSVQVQVSDSSLTTDGQLHAEMLPEAVYNNSTQQFHVQLACGNFKPVWSTRVSVLWKTPGGSSVPSTSSENGRFLLSVPNPVASGEYTCAIDETSPASLCVQSGSSLDRGATVIVDGTEVRFSLMEAKLNAVQREKEQMEASHKEELSALKQQIASMETKHQQEMTSLRQQIQNDVVTSLTSKLDLASQSVSFHADMHNRQVLNNEGNAFDTSHGYFTVPVNGTYVFLVSIVSAHPHPAATSRPLWGATREPPTETSDYTHSEILVDGEKVNECFSSATNLNHYYQGSCHAILKLHAGQQVTLGHVEVSSHYQSFYFSGALLHADL